MKFSIATALLPLIPTLASAQLTFNLTAALAPGEWEKYRCLTTEKWNERIPACIRDCQIQANKKDHCAYDDFVCHCVNYQRFSDLIEPCVFPPSLGGNGTCTFADLTVARPLITDMCNFFNATLYAAYWGCGIELSVAETYNTISDEDVVVTEGDRTECRGKVRKGLY